MKRRLQALSMLLLTGCASFGHGVWNNRQEVFQRLDAAAESWRDAYGTAGYAFVAPVTHSANALLFLLFAGLSGASHAVSAPTTALGITGGCTECEAGAASQPTSRPVHP